MENNTGEVEHQQSELQDDALYAYQEDQLPLCQDLLKADALTEEDLPPEDGYGWIDGSVTFWGYAGISSARVIDNSVQRTLFINGLPNHDLQIHWRNDSAPEFFRNLSVQLLHGEQDTIVIRKAGGVYPVEMAVQFDSENSLMETPGWVNGSIKLLVALLVPSSKNNTMTLDAANSTPRDILCHAAPSLLPFSIEVRQPDRNDLGGILVVGWISLGIIWLTCTVALVWIWYQHHYKKSRAVQVMQPLFLYVLTIGVALFGGTLIGVSITDENTSLQAADAACASIPWFVNIGLTVIFSALFSKLWRINQIFHGAKAYRKLRVTETSVLGPFLLWFSLNSILLAFRTAFFSYEYTRVEVDGNPADTVGTCQDEGVGDTLLFIGNFLVTLSAFVAAAWQAWKARDISDEFSESKTLGMAMLIWGQILVIGVPVNFLVGVDSPVTSYFVSVSMIFGLCIGMLGAIYLPLYYQVQRQEQSRSGGNHGFESSTGSPTNPYQRGHVHISGLNQPNRSKSADNHNGMFAPSTTRGKESTVASIISEEVGGAGSSGDVVMGMAAGSTLSDGDGFVLKGDAATTTDFGANTNTTEAGANDDNDSTAHPVRWAEHVSYLEADVARLRARNDELEALLQRSLSQRSCSCDISLLDLNKQKEDDEENALFGQHPTTEEAQQKQTLNALNNDDDD